ncbi:MAG TPA: alpha-amylase/4-alpha-glucanotransferase domain-containing protein [Patescibacteria group bacterium]|nr:alpha-amylase/4-alpha-glucanotransferase domain-containing protein [Patescibacteria group bacterium]
MTDRPAEQSPSTGLRAGFDPSTMLGTGSDQDKLRFLLVLHNHQPLGNFDEVIQALTDRAYRPLLQAIHARPALKFTLHMSGPLLLWLEQRDPDYLDLIGELVQRGRLELLSGGLYEPILAAIPHEDRIAQITLMSERLRSRFGVRPRGLWLTERIWDSAIIPSLVEAGIAYVLMDDRAFLTSGFEAERLHDYYLTEAEGESLAIFPIDKTLRYLIPFRPPTEIEAHLRWIARMGGRLAIAADDGEKFGGWPGTAKWVYNDGWLKGFLDLLEGAGDWLVSQTVSEALDGVRPAGLCYLPTCSYIEMEEWSLGPDGGRRFEELKGRLGSDVDRFMPHLRGGHWKHFLVRYPEANRAHKKGLALGRLLPVGRGAQQARLELLAAQCNDSYWHGIFGGLYLPHLRHEIWRHLARAEACIRRRQTLKVEATDLDCDGAPEVWVHGRRFSAQIQPHRGGRLVEWTDFAGEVNLLNTLTRRPEAYHDAIRRAAAQPEGQAHEGIPGIHDLQRATPADLVNGLCYDQWERTAFLDHFFIEPHPLSAWVSGCLDERGDFVEALWSSKPTSGGVVLERLGQVRTEPDRSHPLHLRKEYAFTDNRSLTVLYRMQNPGSDRLNIRFGVELNFFLPGLALGTSFITIGHQRASLATPTFTAGVEDFTLSTLGPSPQLRVELDHPVTLHSHLVATVSQSEDGYERTVQGVAAMPTWDLHLDPGQEWEGQVRVTLSE